jgi:hypothetical protein
MLPRPIQNLLTLRDIVREHAPADVAQWFCDGIDQYLAGKFNEVRPGRLERALGLAGFTVTQDYRIAKRNAILAVARRLLPSTNMWRIWARFLMGNWFIMNIILDRSSIASKI